MKIYTVSFFILTGSLLLVLLLLHIKTLMPIRSFLLHAAIGIFSLLAVNISSKIGGVAIPVNLYTVFCSGVLGLPGVIGMLVLNLII